uniref:Ribosomal RNA small subunit methyltransferase A n=1 Tax=Candidatus Kentrum sp. DK TaxID=2126562 RepID=A0A450TEH2_9GAMM|nr:MAG: dimethyladenosine transferase [Candidatus Kentron sp. DK]VFJ65386.1 MAG: dimethyladenosine transferase [Candidatus Kentron sp. DK]
MKRNAACALSEQPPPFRARKRFGQHFLRDRNVIARIVSAIAVESGQIIVEIGPGLGALTEPLLTRIETVGARLHAVELDRDLAAMLAARFQGPDFSLHTADALRFDFAALVDLPRDRNDREPPVCGEKDIENAHAAPLRIVGNLPYNISTPLLFHLLSQSRYIRDMHVMLQRELADRMIAPPGGANYGRLSVMAQWHCVAEKLFDVGAGAFSPPPRVTSSVVRLTIRKTPPARVADPGLFGQIVGRAFSQRRKTLRNSLRGWLTEDEIRAAGVDPGARPETLDIARFAALSNGFAHRKNELSDE